MTNNMEVILYHQKGCGMCATVEMLLKRKNIDYTSVMDIEQMQAEGINHTPALRVDGELLMGRDIINWINSRG